MIVKKIAEYKKETYLKSVSKKKTQCPRVSGTIQDFTSIKRTNVHTEEARANLMFWLALLGTVNILQWLGFWYLTFKWEQPRSWLIFFGQPLNYWEHQWLRPCYLLLWHGAHAELVSLTAKFAFFLSLITAVESRYVSPKFIHQSLIVDVVIFVGGTFGR